MTEFIIALPAILLAAAVLALCCLPIALIRRNYRWEASLIIVGLYMMLVIILGQMAVSSAQDAADSIQSLHQPIVEQPVDASD